MKRLPHDRSPFHEGRALEQAINVRQPRMIVVTIQMELLRKESHV